MSTKTRLTVGFIGAGNMGAAIIAGIHKDFALRVCEQDRRKAAALKKKFRAVTGSLEETVKGSGIIVLAVKPQDFEAVLGEMKAFITVEKTVISIAAGITAGYIAKRLGRRARVVRAMPNLPVTVGEGMTGLAAGKTARPADLAMACRIFNSIGRAVVVAEKDLDAVTAVSGSGPAYVFYFAECLRAAAQKLGVDKRLAETLVAKTLRGAVAMMEASGEDPGALRARVTSKKGTTEAALKVMKAKGFDKTIEAALKAAAKRSKELSRS